MRAFLAVALLAGSCRAGLSQGELRHQMQALTDTGEPLTTDNVETIFRCLKEFPHTRGFLATIMNNYARKVWMGEGEDASGLDFIRDSLMIRLREPETFKWLIDLHASDHD